MTVPPECRLSDFSPAPEGRAPPAFSHLRPSRRASPRASAGPGRGKIERKKPMPDAAVLDCAVRRITLVGRRTLRAAHYCVLRVNARTPTHRQQCRLRNVLLMGRCSLTSITPVEARRDAQCSAVRPLASRQLTCARPPAASQHMRHASHARRRITSNNCSCQLMPSGLLSRTNDDMGDKGAHRPRLKAADQVRGLIRVLHRGHHQRGPPLALREPLPLGFVQLDQEADNGQMRVGLARWSAGEALAVAAEEPKREKRLERQSSEARRSAAATQQPAGAGFEIGD